MSEPRLPAVGEYVRGFGVLKDAAIYCAAKEITPTHPLEVVVVRRTECVRHVPKAGAGFYSAEFRAFDPKPVGGRWDVPESTEAVVWSSRTHLPAREDPPKAEGRPVPGEVRT